MTTKPQSFYDEIKSLFGSKPRALYYAFSKTPKTVEQVDRDVAIYGDQRIKLERQ